MAAQMISNIIRVTENCPAIVKTCLSKKDQRKKQSKAKQNKAKNKKKTKQKQTKQKQNKTKQNKTKQNKTIQYKTKQNKTKQNKTKQNKTKQNKTKTKQNKTKSALPRSLSCLCLLPTMYVTCTCLPYPITSFVIKTLTPAADGTAIAQKSQCYFDFSLVLRFLSGPSIPLWSFNSSLVLRFHSKITVLLGFLAAQFAKWKCSPRFCFFHSSVTTVTKFSTLRKPSNP